MKVGSTMSKQRSATKQQQAFAQHGDSSAHTHEFASAPVRRIERKAERTIRAYIEIDFLERRGDPLSVAIAQSIRCSSFQ